MENLMRIPVYDRRTRRTVRLGDAVQALFEEAYSTEQTAEKQ